VKDDVVPCGAYPFIFAGDIGGIPSLKHGWECPLTDALTRGALAGCDAVYQTRVPAGRTVCAWMHVDNLS
jgi:hypothetical protein